MTKSETKTSREGAKKRSGTKKALEVPGENHPHADPSSDFKALFFSSRFFVPSRLRGKVFVSEFGFRHSDLIRVSGIRISGFSHE
jgi:hypothetical protein